MFMFRRTGPAPFQNSSKFYVLIIRELIVQPITRPGLEKMQDEDHLSFELRLYLAWLIEGK